MAYKINKSLTSKSYTGTICSSFACLETWLTISSRRNCLWSRTQVPNFKACDALLVTKQGPLEQNCLPVRVMAPEPAFIAFTPLNMDAVNAPSTVAMGAMNSPSASSPWMMRGPMPAIGILMRPKGISMFPLKAPVSISSIHWPI
jgi:hypothetical protein